MIMAAELITAATLYVSVSLYFDRAGIFVYRADKILINHAIIANKRFVLALLLNRRRPLFS
jgi:hypothetical protein